MPDIVQRTTFNGLPNYYDVYEIAIPMTLILQIRN